MPNHVSNKISIIGSVEVLQEIVDNHFSGQDCNFDFNSIIPMPDSLHITSGGHVQEIAQCITEYPAFISFIENETNPYKEIKLYALLNNITALNKIFTYVRSKEKLIAKITEAKKAIHNKETYGVIDWYAWANANWGTKWNAYSCTTAVIDDTTLSFAFDTAWSTPIYVLIELSDLYPEIIIEHAYIDEGGGFHGKTRYEKGEYSEMHTAAFDEFSVQEFGWEAYEDEDEDE